MSEKKQKRNSDPRGDSAPSDSALNNQTRAVDSLRQYLNKINEYSRETLSKKQVQDLWERVGRGDRRAKEKITKLNFKLVIPIARKFMNPGAELMDLISEGNLGLMHAIDKFDIKKGFRFSTYASYWIEQYVRRYVEQNSKTIRVPPHAWAILRKWMKEWNNMTSMLGREPTISEMADHLGWNANQVKVAVSASEVVKGIASLETPLQQGEDGNTIADIIVDKSSELPDKIISDLDSENGLRKAMEKIGAREKNILELRYGIVGDKPLTLSEVGAKIGLSRERVRQIEERALLRLRRVAIEMGLIDKDSRHGTPNLQPGWNVPKLQTNIIGDIVLPKGRTARKKLLHTIPELKDIVSLTAAARKKASQKTEKKAVRSAVAGNYAAVPVADLPSHCVANSQNLKKRSNKKSVKKGEK